MAERAPSDAWTLRNSGWILGVGAGADVVATVSRPERLGELPECVPADRAVVVDGVTDGVTEVEPVDANLLVDTVGGAVLSTVLPWVRPGGRAVLVGYLAGTTVEIDLPAFMQRDVSLHPLNMIRREPSARTAAADLLGPLAAGRLTLDVTALPLADAARCAPRAVDGADCR